MSLRSLPPVVVLSLAALGELCAQSKSPVEGVWKVAEVQTIGGQNPGTRTNPQPGLYIFTRGHYSVMTISSDEARTASPQPGGRGGGRGQATLTDAEKIALYDHWAQFTANSGTYTIQGTLTTRPIVAKNENVMQGAPQSREFKVEGSTLWLITKAVPAQTGAETRTKLTRLE